MGDAVSLVRRLGGEQLYGDDPSVVLRELVQNASDAVRARRLVERRPPDWGDIRIRIGGVDGDEWLEVEDNGLGMSKDVLTGPLLDFGQSYWGSQLMVREHPTLLGAGFEPTGRFGIGFFSVFMVARRVTVATRRFDAAQSETFVLEFANGLESRPIVRPADPEERLIDGGTRVRVWLDRPVAELTTPLRRYWATLWSDGLLPKEDGLEELPPLLPEAKIFKQFCAWQFPALQVNLHVREHDQPESTVVVASDWLGMPPSALLLRLLGFNSFPEDLDLVEILRRAETFMRVVGSSSSSVGRAYMLPEIPLFHESAIERCVLTTGGIRVGTVAGAVGIMNGSVGTAARNTAQLAVDEMTLASWAEEQGRIAAWQIDDPTVLSQYAACVAVFGGDPRSLPVIEFRGQWVTGNEIRGWRDFADTYLLVSTGTIIGKMGGIAPGEGPDAYGDVFVLNISWMEMRYQRGGASLRPKRTRFKLLIEALADLWGVTPKAVLNAMDNAARPREIGTRAGNPVVAPTVLLRNPNRRSSAEEFPW
ncbi:MAG: ATP-binding protein [Gemmatimonadetes bacterium]|nr:ATP-binding protein [Gemmatimonadota bacterium]